MGQRITQVDAFTDQPFAGNPAAVCILAHERSADWMQRVALEMNLAETAFLVKQEDGYGLRWFTPTMEVDLCGHATLASAHVLWEEGHLPLTATARFHTWSGLLTAQRREDWIDLDFPAEPAQETDPPAELLPALGVTPHYVGQNRMDYLVVVDTEEEVRALMPNPALLQKVPARGVIVTARSAGADYDFVSRFFAPGAGVDEDPVTGSAHCCLAPYWAEQLHRPEMIGYQASARGGIVRVRLAGDRVILGGQAITTLRGELSEAASAGH
jgi:PhzF family phenazine biosynthesis protein